MSDLRVAMCPDYTSANPYQAGLISGVEPEGIAVVPCDADGIAPLLRTWREERPDLLHIHWPNRFIETDRPAAPVLASLLSMRTLCELLVLRLIGVPTVWTVHNELSHERRTPYIELVFRILLARVVVAMIVHCTAAQARIRDRYRLSDHHRCVVIPHGNYDPFYRRNQSRADARAELKLPADATVLLYFGLIRQYKQVPELVETFRSIQGDHARLLVVGSPWTDAIRRTVEASAADARRVRTNLQYVPEATIEEYFAAADAVVLPYDRVLTSGTAVLAMTFGRAVIAPDAGCLPALLGPGGGIIYGGGEEDGLAAALNETLEDRKRLRRMGDRNRRIAALHSWRSVGRKTAALYRAVDDGV